MSTLDHRAAVAAETARFVGIVEHADPSTPVPSCPGWTLTDLIRHAGSVQRWFAVLLRGRIQQPPTSRDVELKLPEQDAGYPQWLADSLAEATGAFDAGDLDEPMWAWGIDQHARFWVRRMLFETLVHRADAELALGLRPEIDPALALDGVDEFLVNLPNAFPFAPATAELRAEHRTIRFSCPEGRWLVRLRPDGFGLEPDTDGPADAAVHAATAADLLLLLYGRYDRTAASFELSGDQSLLDHWFAHSRF
ncbi:maleylpyruvate isomerase family mycothiol-dependent enzyme [Kitasatospora sp. SUK 42]|uniref:maleylpyruvate isomerase family mycothiol-dependent enzyme n=1 Tax=Kitasatospora sp. SUK 42 TaxID=1588882 RepID=UPI0018CB0ED2|nr:maleylpyruvate isomerase family mycothiol-dependent enzyme [Kitasatospora sp. SUK 42]MBV2156675.1 maleylpyruvate isomerase family mycothiol-dependent enzyme [Kitasatospora sp. SUK 42]